MKRYYLLILVLIPLVCLNTAMAGRQGVKFVKSEDGSIAKEYINNTSTGITLDVPVNDDCENAEAIIAGEYGIHNMLEGVEFSTLEATFDGNGLCQTEPNVWYVYTADLTAEVTVSTDGLLGAEDLELDYDSYLAVYDGSDCPPTSLIACNDDYDENYDYSQITFVATEGNQYLIEVGGIDKGGRAATGTGELLLTSRPIHDIGIWSVTVFRPGMLFDPDAYVVEGIAELYIYNFGANIERFDAYAQDLNVGYYRYMEDIDIDPGQLVKVPLTWEGDFEYELPQDTCIYGELEYKLDVSTFDQVRANNSYTVEFRRHRPIEFEYKNYGDTVHGGEWIWHPEAVTAMEYVSERDEDIVYIGGRVCSGDEDFGEGGSLWFEESRYVDPVNISLYFDENEDGIPDAVPVFEATVVPSGVSPDWSYAVLPCGVSVEEGQHFWVGWSDYRYDRWGYYLAMDGHPSDDVWYFSEDTHAWEQASSDHWGFFLGAWSRDEMVGMADKPSGVPEAFELSQNYPNPFNAQTSIGFALPQAGDVELTVYNTLGQKIDVIALGPMEAGYHTVNWDASDVSTGVYFYKIQAGEFSKTQKMMLLK
jgi:hypothetical protein